MARDGKGQPFFFDKNMFDDDADLKAKDEPPPPPLEYTAIDLENAKARSFADGKKAGFAESEAGFSQKMLLLMQKLEQTAGLMFAAEDERKSVYEREAVQLTLCALQKIVPEVILARGNEEVEKVLGEALRAHEKSDSLTVQVSADALPTMQACVAKLPSGGAHKNITFQADAGLAPGACKMFWSDGGVLYDTEAIAAKIFSILEETLAAAGRNGHDVE
ncbi:MAG: hypothetical protein KDI13_04330 [Alphaproteobacteria bacterium]|nr:hypothetical protein [Alphaproteobacteria bacterium]